MRIPSIVLLIVTIAQGLGAAEPCGKDGISYITVRSIQRVPAKTHIAKKHHNRLPAWVVARNKRIKQERNWLKNHKRVNRGRYTYRTPK